MTEQIRTVYLNEKDNANVEVAPAPLDGPPLAPDAFRVVRPKSAQYKQLFTFDLVAINETTWLDGSNPDDKSDSATFFVGLGGKRNKEPQSQVVAGTLPPDFVKNIRELNFTESAPGSGILVDTSNGNIEDLEWIDSEFFRGKNRKLHNWAYVLHEPQGKEDLVLFCQTPEERSPYFRPAWERMRASFRRL